MVYPMIYGVSTILSVVSHSHGLMEHGCQEQQRCETEMAVLRNKMQAFGCPQRVR